MALGTIVALYTLLGVFGALGCTFLGDILGRRKTIFIASVVQSIGAILQSSAFALSHFIVGRIVLGLGTGGIIATVSVWQSEVSKAESRGAHVSAFGVFCGSGLSLGMWISFGMGFAQPSSASWRFTLIFPLFLSILVCAGIFFLPESPRWLCKMDRWDEARRVLARVYDEDPPGEAVDRELQEIKAALERSGHGSLRGMFRMGPQRSFHRVVLAATAQMFLQMTGINSITYYSNTIYHEVRMIDTPRQETLTMLMQKKQLKFSSSISKVLAASAQLVLILGAFCCAYTVDRFGRRKLMLGSAAGQSICFAFMAGLTSHPDNAATLKTTVFFIYLFFFVYVLGFLGIPFLYASEVAPTHLRAPTCGLSTATSWLFNFLVAEITPIAFNNIGWRYFLVYCCLNAAFVPTVYFFFPETAGRSLEEIDAIFESSKSIFDPVPVARKLPKRLLSEFACEEKGLDVKVEASSTHDEGKV